MADFEKLDIGDIIDYIITYNNQREEVEEHKENTREATQEDFDKF